MQRYARKPRALNIEPKVIKMVGSEGCCFACTFCRARVFVGLKGE